MDTFVAFWAIILKVILKKKEKKKKVILISIFTNLLTNTYIYVLTEGTYHRMSSSQKWQSRNT